MAEVIVRDGTWTFDGEIVRIVPGHDKRVHKLRAALGELTVPLTASAGDGTVSFDGTTIRIEWTEWAEGIKKSAGPQEFALSEVNGVEWVPIVGMTNGFLRFRVTGASALQPKHDPKCTTWGWIREGGTTSPDGAGSDHDTVLRRLRELGDLHRDGVLTDDEFATAKQALLREL